MYLRTAKVSKPGKKRMICIRVYKDSCHECKCEPGFGKPSTGKCEIALSEGSPEGGVSVKFASDK